MVLNSKFPMTSNRYTVLVCGDVDLNQYNLNTRVPRYVRYKYSERESIQLAMLEMYKAMIEELSDQPLAQALLQIQLSEFSEMTPEEFFEELTKGYYYDEETGDAMTDINPLGKWFTLETPTVDTAVPLFNNDSPFEGVKNDVISDIDSTQKNIHNALFYNAFVSTETGWVEEADENSEQWVLSFYDRFIKNLPNDTKLKVYNFTR